MIASVLCFLVLLMIILSQQNKIQKLNIRLEFLEKHQFNNKSSELYDLRSDVYSKIKDIPSLVHKEINNFIKSEGFELDEFYERLGLAQSEFDSKLYNSERQLFRLIVSFYEEKINHECYKYVREYIDDNRPKKLKTTYAGDVDMINWLKPVFKGKLHHERLCIFYDYYCSYIKDKDQFKDNDDLFIEFMSMHMTGLKFQIEAYKEFDEMSKDEIWVELIKRGTRYNSN